jgi:hypothetical protein
MHSLYGLQKLGLTFELKGGTSLSKGFKIIDRFSEDIDIHIDPPADQNVKTGRNQDKPAEARAACLAVWALPTVTSTKLVRPFSSLCNGWK